MGINWLAVLAAAVLCMIIGFLWYSPALFAKPWMLAHGYDPNDEARLAEMQKGAAKLYAVAFLASSLAAAMLAKVLAVTGVHNALYGVKMGFGVWLGFVMTVQLTGTLFAKRPLKLFYIDTGYQLVCFLGMGALLASWYAR
jgi:hypothetical protein